MELPGICGSELAAQQWHAGSGLALAAVGGGFSAWPISGCAVPRRGRSRFAPFQPAGLTRELRRNQLDGLAALNRHLYEKEKDPEIETRIAQYEMAFRMQASVPELADTSREPEHVYSMYGEESRKPGTFAANCLLARRLAERNVRFIQLYHRGWDHHGGLTEKLPSLARDTDQPSAALVLDLEQRGISSRQYAGYLGWRIRPHTVRAGSARSPILMAAIIMDECSHCGWQVVA